MLPLRGEIEETTVVVECEDGKTYAKPHCISARAGLAFDAGIGRGVGRTEAVAHTTAPREAVRIVDIFRTEVHLVAVVILSLHGGIGERVVLLFQRGRCAVVPKLARVVNADTQAIVPLPGQSGSESVGQLVGIVEGEGVGGFGATTVVEIRSAVEAVAQAVGETEGEAVLTAHGKGVL